LFEGTDFFLFRCGDSLHSSVVKVRFGFLRGPSFPARKINCTKLARHCQGDFSLFRADLGNSFARLYAFEQTKTGVLAPVHRYTNLSFWLRCALSPRMLLLLVWLVNRCLDGPVIILERFTSVKAIWGLVITHNS
jgi:hypothetical protein